jgi:phage terminase small subunit
VAELENAKRERFCREFIIDLNGTQAAIRAGYSKRSAAEQAYDLLRNPQVEARVAELKAAQFRRLHMSADEVLLELARIGRSDLRKVFDANGNLKPLHELDDDTAAAIASVEVTEKRQNVRKLKDPDEGEDQLVNEVESIRKIRAWDKTKALDILAKHHGLFEQDNRQAGAAIADAFKSDRDFARRVAFFLTKGMRAEQ